MERGDTRYTGRVIDEELDELLGGLSALAIEGPKAVGKTATALRRAKTVYRLDDPAQAELVAADPGRLATGAPPILIDEWQRVPESWDIVRRSVDADPSPNRFLLTGSAAPTAPPTAPPTHSGAGRIVRLRMRPFSLAERGLATPSVSLRQLMGGGDTHIQGETSVNLGAYTEEILRSGFPGIRQLRGRALRAQLEGYVARMVDKDLHANGGGVRNSEALIRWMRAYAAATATTATFETIRDAATVGENKKPARPTAVRYRDALARLWLLDPVAAWLPSKNYFSRLTHPAKHHLADPALAAVLLGASVDALLEGDDTTPIPAQGPLLGRLFESLVTQSVRVYAQAAEAEVKHFRTKAGRHEVDLIVERADQRVLAIEVKLARTVSDHDVRQLLWLKERMRDDLVDAVVITTGPNAYRRPDGVAVVPAALLGP